MLNFRTLLAALTLVGGLTACSGSTADDSSAAVDECGADAPRETHTCTELCTLYFENCTDYQTKFADQAACEADCPTEAGPAGDCEGNTLGCRYQHASEAANDDHCDEANGDLTCVE